jgi:hypothetical protein
MQNPINLVDPTGMSSEEPGDGDPPKKEIRSRLDGWNKTVSNFNNSINSGINEFMRGNPFENTAEATLNFLNNSVSTLVDITGMSNLMGFENRTANAISSGINTIIDFPNMSSEEQGSIIATGTIKMSTLLLTKKAPSLLGASRGSLSGTKDALLEAKSKLGLKSNESLPKGKQGKYGSPQRGDSNKGYRLDPAHPNAKSGSGEEYPHINIWDYTKGNRGKRGFNEAIPIKK